MQTLRTLLEQALLEDCPNRDITADWFVPHFESATGKIIAKQAGIFYGESIIREIIDIVDPTATITMHTEDGATLSSQALICTLYCGIHPLLKAERVLLNLLQRLSGIATMTRQFVTALNNPAIDVMDTRKTTPLMRFLERSAVVAGGGKNHRLNLSDMVLVKENHLKELDKLNKLPELGRIVMQFKHKHPEVQVEIEVETLDQLRTWDLGGVDIIMLDNFDISDIPIAIEICKERKFNALLEVSGNITLNTIGRYQHFDIHRISTGAITHSAPALDLSLLIQ